MIVTRLQTARRAAVRHARAAERAGFAAHEQALTEVVLTRAAPAVRVWTFSQREEATTGADWLWWWRGQGEWFGSLVQAKRNKPALSRPWYDFGYRTSSGDRQIDRLLSTAGYLDVPAVYVLYNHPPIARSVPVSMPCCTVPREGWRARLGVAVVPALAVRSLVDGSEDVAVQYARPLECMASQGMAPRLVQAVRRIITDPGLIQLLEGQALTLPRLVARGLLGQLADMRLAQFRRASSELGRPAVDVAAADRVLVNLPLDEGHFAEPYFEHVLRGLRRGPPEYVVAAVEGAPMKDFSLDLEGVKGLVILGDVESE
jgi:hypothetical protein